MEINKPKERMYSEVIEHYYNQYKIDRSIISGVIQKYGDSKFTHEYLESLINK